MPTDPINGREQVDYVIAHLHESLRCALNGEHKAKIADVMLRALELRQKLIDTPQTSHDACGFPKATEPPSVAQQSPPWDTFKAATCRGSYALGSACGHCERCDWEKKRIAQMLAK